MIETPYHKNVGRIEPLHICFPTISMAEILPFFIFLFISAIPRYFSLQNIPTFYPLVSPPPAVFLPSPSPVNNPPPPSPGRTSRSPGVGRAIGISVASTLVLSGLLFFLLHRFISRKRERETSTAGNGRTNNPPILPNNNFMRFNGNLKGIIVDENGLDVLYLRNLEEGERKVNFKKQYYRNIKDAQKEEEKTMVDERRRKSPPVQEVPLLRGKSSTSQCPFWRENGIQMINTATISKEKTVPPPPPPSVPTCRFDEDLMEAMFGTVAKNLKSPQRNERSRSPRGDKPGPPSPVFILDARKSQNIANVLKSLGLSRTEIIDSLIEGQDLNADAVEKLTRITPTQEEASDILSFDGNPTRLADAESFLFHLLKSVPSAFTRFNAMFFRSNYRSEVSNVKESLNSLETACKELRNKGLFLKMLEAVLKAGNRLNSRNGQAFNLMALRKLSDVKSSDGETTLLRFVVQEVIRAEGKICLLNKNRSLSWKSSQNNNGVRLIQTSDTKFDREREYMKLGLAVIGGLSSEFKNTKMAATLDYDLLQTTSSALLRRVTEIRKDVGKCGTESEGGFVREMKRFLDTADMEMEELKRELERVMELVKKTTDYYQADSGKDKRVNPLQTFVIVRDFLEMIDQICIDIARNLQSTEPGSSVAVTPRVFRFRKLPPDFLSESCSSDSDDISEELR